MYIYVLENSLIRFTCIVHLIYCQLLIVHFQVKIVNFEAVNYNYNIQHPIQIAISINIILS